jgi:hypothetical protein
VAALGPLLDELDPGLRSYFGELPPGVIGLARGTFDVVGSPRHWLWPFLRLVADEGIATATWQRNVPFTVYNRPDRRRAVQRAERQIALPTGTWTMIDAIAAVGPHNTLVDDLGRNRRLRVVLEPSVVDGSLVLRSTRVGIRLGVLRLRVPRAIAPRVTLVESFDGARGRRGEQHVSVVIDLPVIGRVYEYSGWFDYMYLDEGPRS